MTSIRTRRTPPVRPRRAGIGPATVVAVAVAGALAASGMLRPREAAPHVLEPGAFRVPARSSVLPPLHKPEVGDLARGPAASGLSARQRARLHALEAAWASDRAELLAAMRGEIGHTPGQSAGVARGVSVAGLQSGLAGYSEMSRRYDALRREYYERGAAIAGAVGASGEAGGER